MSHELNIFETSSLQTEWMVIVRNITNSIRVSWLSLCFEENTYFILVVTLALVYYCLINPQKNEILQNLLTFW